MLYCRGEVERAADGKITLVMLKSEAADKTSLKLKPEVEPVLEWFILADDMGIGKTLTMLAYLAQV